jgi:putative RNA 2'-phosphotransferase
VKRKQLALSRTISHALRHEPWIYELELDAEGWVNLDMLLRALRRRPEWKVITESDIVDVMKGAEKQRFEIRAGRIRALYGHSTSAMLKRKPMKPPDVLYHGTSPETLKRIFVEGLRSMKRHYVHLSVDQRAAMKVGKRKSSAPAILKVKAARAYDAGIAFYKGNDHVWLADTVPPTYLREI